MKRRKVVYAAEAGDDLDWIYATVATASDPVTANDYDRRIRSSCERLETASERGHRRDDIRPGLRIVGFEKRVTIAFAVEADTVLILRVFYGGVDWEAAF
ncbi:type II toxin-antitoxin system RelE/ParE family toxin [Methylopila sp. M107]|uniref:type II toxin-antitoxin system RelE/ParE family toxin n=1 Tax=Methylopila sp. M107 TaxID=1101190 RepID=UPI0003669228|nr:type II toxin-antitoxin system RelE/ParE family toxin [Methylopila sp. M107]